MTILVLGASGFVGSWVVRALLNLGFPTTALVRPSSNTWRLNGLPGLKLISDSNWRNAVSLIRPEVVVSLDWEGVAGANRDDESQWDNIERQGDLILAASRAGARRFVGTGSQAEYGPRRERIEESMTPEPKTSYGKAKLAAMAESRRLCAELGMEWGWARVFSVFGPLDNGHWLLPSIADALLSGQDVSLTTGEQLWSYLYASDAGTAFATLATHPSLHGIYNLGSPKAPELRSTIERFAEHFNSPAKLLFGDRQFGPDPVMRLEPNMSRLTDLGWSEATDLEDGISATADWLQRIPLPDPFFRGQLLPRRPV